MNIEIGKPNHVSPETVEDGLEIVTDALKTIGKTEQFVAEKTGLNGSELTKATDEALVYVASETAKTADEDGIRTETETVDIKKAVKTIIVEGALEKTGIRTTPGNNPILNLENFGLGQELVDAIGELHTKNAKLPNGEDVAEKAVEVLTVPDILYRGERVYLSNIDQIGKHDISTAGHERVHNQHGKVYLARDKAYAMNYSVGKDGVTFYDKPLPKEQIPIGVIYEIDNKNNITGAVSEGEPLPDFIANPELAGKHREFTADSVPKDNYRVLELQIMDDFTQPNGHRRSDFRSILKTFPVDNPEDLPKVIQAVKNCMHELDAKRNGDDAEQGKNTSYLVTELKEKFDYGEQLTDALEKIVPAMAEYYGNAELVFEALRNCPIHIQEHSEDIAKFVSDFFSNSKIDNIPILAQAFYTKEPVLNNDGSISIKHLIYLRERLSDLSDNKNLSTLVHEIGHLVNGYKNGAEIGSDTVKTRYGLSENTYTLDSATGEFTEQTSTNTGLEEMMSTYDEEQIMRKILRNDSYIINSNFDLRCIAADYLPNTEFLTALKNDRLNGTHSAETKMGLEQYRTLADSTSKIINSYYVTPAQALDKEYRKKILADKKAGIEETVKILSRKKIDNPV